MLVLHTRHPTPDTRGLTPRDSNGRPFRGRFRGRFRGFTLIELLVAVSIIGILIAITIPAIGAMGKGTRSSAAVNSISVGVQVARYHATRQINPKDLDGVNFAPYRGAAAIVTPSNEVRIVEHDQLGENGSGNKLELISDSNGDYRAGFKDVAGVEYLRLPKNVYVFGFRRNATGSNGLVFMTPPFAIRFDQFGNLVVGNPTSSKDRLVYYDGNCNNQYNNTVERPSNYLPPAAPAFNTSKNRYVLDFEQIETVTGLYIIEADSSLNLSASGGVLSDAATIAKIKADGKQIMFSRYTGNPMRND